MADITYGVPRVQGWNGIRIEQRICLKTIYDITGVYEYMAVSGCVEA